VLPNHPPTLATVALQSQHCQLTIVQNFNNGLDLSSSQAPRAPLPRRYICSPLHSCTLGQLDWPWICLKHMISMSVTQASHLTTTPTRICRACGTGLRQGLLCKAAAASRVQKAPSLCRYSSCIFCQDRLRSNVNQIGLCNQEHECWVQLIGFCQSA